LSARQRAAPCRVADVRVLPELLLPGVSASLLQCSAITCVTCW